MARHAKTISQGTTSLQHLSVGMIALCFPLKKVQEIINKCGRKEKRIRDLPAALVVYFVISLSLFPGVSTQAVADWLLTGMRWLKNFTYRSAKKAGLSHARIRLGYEVLEEIFKQLTKPLNDKTLKGSYWKNMQLVGLDGSTLALQDTKENTEHFKKPSNQSGDAGYPLARYVALVELGTHIVIAAELGGYKDSEITLAKKIIPSLTPNMLCLADRLFAYPELWSLASATKANLVWRAKVGLKLKPQKYLDDGSYIATWKSDKTQLPLTIRVIEYEIKNPETGKVEAYRIITTILDEKLATAHELASLYPSRWEIEITFKENKTILRSGQITLRSKTPDLVKQEFWGLLLAHYLVRKAIADAALRNDIDPDEISYSAAVEIIKQVQAGSPLKSPP